MKIVENMEVFAFNGDWLLHVARPTIQPKYIVNKTLQN